MFFLRQLHFCILSISIIITYHKKDFALYMFFLYHLHLERRYFSEALESVRCEVIKIILKERDATRSGKGFQLLDIKTVVVVVLKLGLPNFGWSFILFYFLLHPSFLDIFYDVTHATFQPFIFLCAGIC